MIVATRSRFSGEEQRAIVSLTKYGFPRRRMLPAARFRQWHFNRTPKSSKLSCLHLHRVLSFLLVPFPPLVASSWRRLVALLYTNLHVVPPQRSPREVWPQMCAELLSHRTAGIRTLFSPRT